MHLFGGSLLVHSSSQARHQCFMTNVMNTTRHVGTKGGILWQSRVDADQTLKHGGLFIAGLSGAVAVRWGIAMHS
jgi:hypothetical protein